VCGAPFTVSVTSMVIWKCVAVDWMTVSARPSMTWFDRIVRLTYQPWALAFAALAGYAECARMRPSVEAVRAPSWAAPVTSPGRDDATGRRV
jgi:hypothetical protein